MEILHARADGTFVVQLPDGAYHVTQDHPLYDIVAAAAEGREFPPEPPPRVFSAETVPPPTKAQLQAQLAALAAQIEALP